MKILISILAFGTLGAVTLFGIINERATQKRKEALKRGEIGKSALSEDGIRERLDSSAEQQPS